MKYEASYGWDHLFTVEIADTAETLKACREMVEFWSGGEDRLDRHNDDAVLAFVQQVAEYVVRNNELPSGEGYYDFPEVGIVFSRFTGWTPDVDEIEIKPI